MYVFKRQVIPNRVSFSPLRFIKSGKSSESFRFSLNFFRYSCNTTTVVGIKGTTLNPFSASAVFEGAMNKVRFGEHVRNVLCPTLRKGDIIVWDNLPAHRSVVARKLVEATGATLMPLPSYSPDFNPIEMSFSKLKSILRKEKIHDVGKLHEFLLASGKLFSSIECENYFRKTGCGLQ